LKNIKKLAAGANHVLALDDKGVVWAWGSGQQSQLGRRIIERTKKEGLNPAPAVIKHNENDRRNIKIIDIGCGAYNSFAIDKDGNIWSWGANNYGECGHFSNAGEDRAIVLWPSLVEDLEKNGKSRQISQIQSGAHHTVALTKDGECLVWGRCDGGQTGIPLSDLNKEHVITNTGMTAAEVESKEGQVETRSYKILAHPTAIPAIGMSGIEQFRVAKMANTSFLGSSAVFATCGTDHTIIITDKGKAWTSGFSANYQTGQGTDRDIDAATMIDNTATRNRKLIWAGAGGQYSVFAAEQEGTSSNMKINGV
jgi:regulator of chromosome condensation